MDDYSSSQLALKQMSLEAQVEIARTSTENAIKCRKIWSTCESNEIVCSPSKLLNVFKKRENLYYYLTQMCQEFKKIKFLQLDSEFELLQAADITEMAGVKCFELEAAPETVRDKYSDVIRQFPQSFPNLIHFRYLSKGPQSAYLKDIHVLSNLKELYLDSIQSEELAKILQCCSSLTHLIIYNMGGNLCPWKHILNCRELKFLIIKSELFPASSKYIMMLPKLEHLSAHGLYSTLAEGHIANIVSQKHTFIETITLPIFCEAINLDFTECVNLRQFYLNYYHPPPSYLLPKTIKKLSFLSCDFMTFDYFLKIVQQCTDLNVIVINFITINEELIYDIINWRDHQNLAQISIQCGKETGHISESLQAFFDSKSKAWITDSQTIFKGATFYFNKINSHKEQTID